MISGILHKKRNTSQATRKLPAPSVPPLDAAIRGNLQIFPVPTAIPRALTKNANLEEKQNNRKLMTHKISLFEMHVSLFFEVTDRK